MGESAIMKVLITGGSRGIGKECVREFCMLGYEVYFLYKNSDDAARELEKETGGVAIKCDISSFDDVKKAYETIGDVDIIVNNAGISQIKMFQDIDENDWDDMFNVNIKGMYIVTKTFLSSMINKKWGRIVNISSMWGETGASCEVHYSASKAAVIGFTKALAKELGPSNITVNCIAPGFIETEMNNHLSDEEKMEIYEETPLMRGGKADEIAKEVVHLCGDDAGFITGAVIHINGGMVI